MTIKRKQGRPGSPKADSIDKAGRSDTPVAGASEARFLIVGVGASAGGLEAFTNLLQELPPDTGMAFILVQHLDPDHDSALTGLLAKATPMPVCQVTDNQPVEPDQVYVIPPNTKLSISGGHLRLQPRQKQPGAQHAIDFFFESLAEDAKERAIGIVLSGTASDGTIGIEAIKAEGGITIAQDESAKYDSMPRNAIAAGCVDFVLSPVAIARELTRIAKHPCFAAGAVAEPADKKGITDPPGSNGDDDALQSILSWLTERRGVDFSCYKPNTIERRISRRMVLSKVENYAEYARFLRSNPEEIDELYADVLIGVTSFFRNPEAFEALKQVVFPQVVEKENDEPVRLWVAGCSSGQEVYSLAMAFAEFREQSGGIARLQIFATDLNEAALERGRAGLYGNNLVGDVSPERLERFFVEEDGGYRIKKALRESIIFARHNLVTDPPFSRMDIISCRNLMIYLDSVLQKQVVPLFHYGLKPNGFLFLGASESVGQFTELFEAVDSKHRIFCRKPGPTPPMHRFVPGVKAGKAGMKATASHGAVVIERSAEREADRIAVKRFAPPGVLIDAELRILQFRGSTAPYLEARSGKASLQLLSMAREGLMLPLRSTIEEARQTGQPVTKENVRLYQGGASRVITIDVIPLKNLNQPCYLVLFEEESKKTAPNGRSGKPGAEEESPVPATSEEDARTITDLQTELAETHEYVHLLQEQYATSSEELQASNEEAHSANEELQSINEELETSKEELESTNEELTTVNEELAHRNTDLNRLNNDLVNLQNSVQTAVVLLGPDLTIRRFNLLAGERFSLVASDVGRSITTVRLNFDFPKLKQWISGCIEKGSRRETEVCCEEGRWYSLRALPYLTDNGEVDGAVLVMVDIDALKRNEQELNAAREYAQAIVDDVAPLVVMDSDLRVVTVNNSFLDHFKVTRAETENCLVFELGNGQWNIPALRTALTEILPKQGVVDDFEVEHDFESIGQRTLTLNARQLDHVQRILLRIDDVTTEKQAIRNLEDLNRNLEDRVAERTAEIQARVGQLQRLSLELANAEYHERSRLASLLHDDIQQILVAVKMHVATSTEDGNQAKKVAFLQEMLDQAIDGTRSLAKQLAPPVLAERGLGPALEWLARWAAERYSLNVQVETDPMAEPKNSGMRTFLFENVRELLLNVVKHAGTDRVTINLARKDDLLHLQVEDFGTGFDFKAMKLKAGESGFGLTSLQERLVLMGGRMEVKTAPGQGTRVDMIVPLEAALPDSGSDESVVGGGI